MSLRIAMISEHASPIARPGSVDSGGQNVYVARLARHLVRRGHKVDVYTRRDSDVPERTVCASGVRVIHVPAGPPRFIHKEQLLPYMDPFARFMLRRWREAGGYDLVHANFFMSGLVGCQIKAETGVPLVITFHALGRVRRQYQGQADQFPAERLAIEDRIIEEADRIIAECPQDEEDQVRLYGADPAKIRVVPCGFDETELWPVEMGQARERLGLERYEPLVLQVGRLVPRKGADNAIRGFARLMREHRIAARMIIVGGESKEPDPVKTPEIGRLQSVARDEGIADRVVFAGQVDRSLLKFYYSAADVFVTTPWYEPFGMTPLEAMACGAPVVGSNVGGIKFTVRDGQTGFLVPPNDPDTLGERLAALCRRPDLRQAFSKAAVTWVNRWFTWRQVSNMVAEVYDDLLGRLARPRPVIPIAPLAPATLATREIRNA
jgi:glycosyltransferase involved in cell wall biosynthesis